MMLSTLLVLQPSMLVGAYSGFPGCSNPLGLKLSVISHSATIKLAENTSSASSLTLIKNLGKQAGAITIQIPTHVRGAGTMGALQGLSFSASWDKTPLNLGNPAWGPQTNTNALISKDGFVMAQVTVKPNATHALRVSSGGDVLSAGPDGKERCLAYDMTTVGSWQSAIGKFNYSIQCASPNTIFSVISKTPKSGWQVGPKGAYFARSGFSPQSNLTLYFGYYPSHF